VVEPASTPQDGRILLRELVDFTNAPAAVKFGVSGELDIAGLKITPEFAGIDLPGRIDIFTTTDVPSGTVDVNTPRGPVAITSLADLSNLPSHIQVVGRTSFDDFATMTPAQ